MTFAIGFLIVFALVIIAIGAYSARFGARTAEDYFIAGRTLGVVATFFGLVATQMSGFIFMGMGAQAYLMGVGAFNQTVAGTVLIVIYLYLWRRLWQVGKQNGYITQADLLVDRYESPTFMRLVPALLGIVAITAGHFGIQFIATGLIFNVISGGALPYWFGVVFTAVVVLLVVLLGGFRATAWTDIFMGSWIIISLVSIFFLTTGYLGTGVAGAFQEVAAKFPKMVSPPGEVPFWTPVMLVAWLINMIGFTQYPQMHVRSYAAKSDKVFPMSALFWIPASFIICSVPTTIGVFARLIWASPKELGVAPDGVIPMLVTQIVPVPWLIPILLSGALAAIISTISGSVIAISGIVTHDLIRSKISPNLSQERAVWWGRIIVFVATLVAVIIALLRLNLISVLFVSANGIVTLFLIPIVGGLVWPRLNKQGAIWGLLVGEIFLLWLTYGPKSLGGGHLNQPIWLGLPAYIWALLLQLVVTVVVTLATPAPPDRVQKKFFAAGQAEA